MKHSRSEAGGMTEEAWTVTGRTKLHKPLDGDGCLLPDEQQPTFVSHIDSLRGTTAWSPSENWVIPKRPHRHTSNNCQESPYTVRPG